MSLLVWLPMTKDLSDQGLGGCTITNNGATLDNNGKLGKCYNFDGTDDRILVAGLNKPKDISIAFWLKRNATTNTRQFLFTAWSGVSIELTTTNTIFGKVSFSSGEGGSASGGTITADTGWVHVCYTFEDGVGGKMYINGELKASGDTTNSINWSSTTAGYIGNYSNIYLNAKLNDFRIYDHALSPKEVKELSKGLVCHYPLNGNGRSGDNLLPHTNPSTYGVGYLQSYSNGTVTVDSSTTFQGRPTIKVMPSSSTTSSGGYSAYNTSVNLANGKQYCYSCWIKSTVADTWSFNSLGHFQTNTASASHNRTIQHEGDNIPANTWTQVYITFTPTADCKFYSYHIYFTNTSQTIWIANVKLEEGDHPTPWMPNSADDEYTKMGYDSTTEYDTSGYNYHGTRNNTFTWDSNTARYSVSTVFNGSDNSIQIPFCQALGLTASGKTDYTWACWIYVSTLSSKGYATILGGQSGFEAETKYNSDGTPKLWAYSWGSSSYSYNLNEWVHIAATQTSMESKWYVNGELAFTGSSTNIPYGNFFIGSWRDTNSQNFKGNVSDFRIYATALSADDIKELYDTVASVTNNGTLLTRGEFVET